MKQFGGLGPQFWRRLACLATIGLMPVAASGSARELVELEIEAPAAAMVERGRAESFVTFKRQKEVILRLAPQIADSHAEHTADPGHLHAHRILNRFNRIGAPLLT